MLHVVIPLVIIGIAIYAAPRLGKSTTIEQNGNQLSIAIGDHRLTATVVGNEITDSFLVIGGGISCGGFSCGDLYFTSLLSVIPMDTAEQLYLRYGNFRKCSSPGARQGIIICIPRIVGKNWKENLGGDVYQHRRTLRPQTSAGRRTQPSSGRRAPHLLTGLPPRSSSTGCTSSISSSR